MKQLNIREVRQELAHLDELLAREGELIITRRGEPIARVLPLGRQPGFPDMREFLARQKVQSVPSEDLLAAEREERC